jgi:hypothetical protein
MTGRGREKCNVGILIEIRLEEAYSDLSSNSAATRWSSYR